MTGNVQSRIQGNTSTLVRHTPTSKTKPQMCISCGLAVVEGPTLPFYSDHDLDRPAVQLSRGQQAD